VSGWDKKLLCAELNFCLFRYAAARSMIMVSLCKPLRKKRDGGKISVLASYDATRVPN